MSSTTRHLLAPSAVRWATRLGPSRRCPGAVGVFAAAHLKKYTPVEVVPNCITATADFSPPELQHEAREMAKTTTTTLVRAPPQLLKLTAAPRGTISLRRFLALRQHMCSGSYLHVATLSAWYVLVPSYTVPLDDEVGLHRWCDLHHHRYYSPARRPRQQRRRRGRGGEGDALQQFRMNKFDELAQMEEEGVEQRTTTTTTTNEEDTSLADDDNDEDADELVEHMSSTNTNNRVLQQAPMALPERHLFEINDGVHLPLPPTDDVAHDGYWRQLGPRMMLYRSAHDLSREDYDAYITEILDATPQTSSSITTTEQERLLAGQYAFQALTEKANVQLEVSDVSGLVTLKPLMDIAEGDELLLHYGREWWMHRLMSILVLAATSGAEMARVRPLEQLCMEVCGEPTDVREGFPMLMPVWRKPDSRRSRLKKKKKRGTLSSSSSTSSTLTLLNLTTNAEATSEAVLAFAIRQSCFDKKWLTSLVHTHTNGTRNDDDDMNASSSAVFHRERPDEEVPVAQLRRALAEHLRRHGPTTTAAAEGDETTASPTPLPPSVALDVLSEDVVDGDEDEESPEQHFSV